VHQANCAGVVPSGAAVEAIQNSGECSTTCLGSGHHWSPNLASARRIPECLGFGGICRSAAWISRQANLEMVVGWCLLGDIGLQGPVPGGLAWSGGLRKFGIHLCHRRSATSTGWCFMTVAGQLSEGSVGACRTLMTALYAHRLQKQSIICWSLASLPRRSGSLCFMPLGCSN